jgi:predicted nucleotidyltransferase
VDYSSFNVYDLFRDLMRLRSNTIAREGDMLETSEGLIFDVKGFLHPSDRVIAYLRYYPDARGSRQRAGVRYQRVYDLDERNKLLRNRWPLYLHNSSVLHRQVQAVPNGRIRRHYLPLKMITELQERRDLDQLESLAREMAQTLAREATIPLSKIGLSGSILVGLHTNQSDIDLMIYGAESARVCYQRLTALVSTRSSGFSPLASNELHHLYMQRVPTQNVPFARFAEHEGSKVLQGEFKGKQYFLRCVREWGEITERYGDREFFPLGRMRLTATIIDDSDSILTPCRYLLSNIKIVNSEHDDIPIEIVSFRGRYCEQVHTGDHIVAEGLLEGVKEQSRSVHRLIIGENPKDQLLRVG